MNDEQAIARLKQGDLESLEVLASRYYLRAVRAAYLVVQDRELAEDVVQNAFQNLEQSIRQYDSGRPFEAWFLRCVINNAINTGNREKRLVSLDQLADSHTFSAEEWLQDQAPGPAEQSEETEQRQAIWQALEQLTPQQRAAIVMRYYLELNENEMANELACPKSSLKWWLYSARLRLRELLKAFGPVSEGAVESKEK